jgi:hypothetical protein
MWTDNMDVFRSACRKYRSQQPIDFVPEMQYKNVADKRADYKA